MLFLKFKPSLSLFYNDMATVYCVVMKSEEKSSGKYGFYDWTIRVSNEPAGWVPDEPAGWVSDEMHGVSNEDDFFPDSN